MRSLALSADRLWLSGLDVDSLLSKQETKFERSFSYLKHIDRKGKIVLIIQFTLLIILYCE